jgi:hypothetical protein
MPRPSHPSTHISKITNKNNSSLATSFLFLQHKVAAQALVNRILNESGKRGEISFVSAGNKAITDAHGREERINRVPIVSVETVRIP